jgi:hypothetical protein
MSASCSERFCSGPLAEKIGRLKTLFVTIVLFVSMDVACLFASGAALYLCSTELYRQRMAASRIVHRPDPPGARVSSASPFLGFGLPCATRKLSAPARRGRS